jgi:thiamine phosphate synthase YjbQ (UPF0047 family)
MHKACLSEIQFTKVPIEDPGARRLHLGTWQEVVGINHHNCARRRTIEATLFKG